MGLVNYTPAFNITGHDLINKRLQSLSLIDSPGYISDTLTIVINIEDVQRHNWPKSSDQLTVELGWKESGLVSMGTFTISKIKPLYLPKRLQITATAAQFNAKSGDVKLRRSQSYIDKTLGDIVKTCASRLQLLPRIHKQLSDVAIDHIDQKNETDLSFLQRLAIKYDAVVKPVDQNLVFSMRGQSKTLTGKELAPVPLQLYSGNKAPQNALLSVSFVEPEKNQFKGVRADWYDIDNAEIVRYQTGQEPFKQLTGRFKSAAQAIDAAQSELKRTYRQNFKVSYSVAGEPLLMAEGAINLSGFDEEHINGLYSNDRITHSYSNGTYKTSGEASAIL